MELGTWSRHAAGVDSVQGEREMSKGGMGQVAGRIICLSCSVFVFASSFKSFFFWARAAQRKKHGESRPQGRDKEHYLPVVAAVVVVAVFVVVGYAYLIILALTLDT